MKELMMSNPADNPQPTPAAPSEGELALWKRYVKMLSLEQPRYTDAMEFGALKAQLKRSDDDIHKDRHIVGLARFLCGVIKNEQNARLLADGQARDKWRQRIQDAAREANQARHELAKLTAAHPGLVAAVEAE